MSKPLVSIIVANWNGEHWLSRCVSSLQISARASKLAFELIVVDDASSDGSCAMIREQFPRVRLLVNRTNRGFARTINRGVKAARGKVVILCNNDLLVREEFVFNLARWLVVEGRETLPRIDGAWSDEPYKKITFGVSAKTVGWYDGKPNQVCMGAVWKGGRVTPAYKNPEAPTRCLFLQAGAAAYLREKFLELGGLSHLFEPGYWEDYDLSWRAARRGMAMIYDPAAFALHVGGGSMTKRYGARAVADMKARNHLLFEAANLRSPRLLAEWCARVPLTMSRAVRTLNTDGNYCRALLACRERLPLVVAARRRHRGELLSDEQILAPFRDFTPSY
jgi:GT2 family glycosyltransferase